MITKKTIVVLLSFLILCVVSSIIVFVFFAKQFLPFVNTNKSSGGQTACTTEAKLCSDGSYVARSGPNCEFAVCPENKITTTSVVVPKDTSLDFHLYKNDAGNLSFQTLASLSTYNFVKIMNWPPEVTLVSGTFSCETVGADAQNKQVQKSINNRVYCVSLSSEGAAGSIYNTYKYTTERNGKLLDVSFVAQLPQCMNYDNPQQQQCSDEESKFYTDVDNIVDSIVNSAKVDDEYMNATYNNTFTFVNGVFEKKLFPGSAEKMVIKYLGYDLKGDFNNDGLEDIAFIATENDGGSGSFYSLYAYLSSPQGYVGSNDILLGDRVRVQSIQFTDNKLVVNYLDHGSTQALGDEPNTLISKKILVSNYTQLSDLSLPQATF
ncbi:MAG: hypothetical protein WC025_00455 [Candidatus Magasanikbacteria bacterium]